MKKLNSVTLWFSGQVACIFIGIIVGMQSNAAFGIATAFALGVLVDIRLVLSQLLESNK